VGHTGGQPELEALVRTDGPATQVKAVSNDPGALAVDGDRITSPMGSDFYCEQALSGRTPVTVVAETEHVLAFEHTRPTYPVHIVVVPKRHTPSLIELGEGGAELLTRVLEVVRRVAAKVTAEHGACRVVTNLGAYQDSKHLHFHVISGHRLPGA
jgi:histidine triad (HIT) family protein